MKKSCIGKESKVVTTEDVTEVLNDSKEETEKELTEEELFINKKLSESGIQDEGLGWLEKRNILKTITVSLNTTGSERLQRSSPRLAKNNSLKGAKWVENSFEDTKNDDPPNISADSDSTIKTKGGRGTSDIVKSSRQKASSPLLNTETSEIVSEAETPKTNSRKGVSNSDSVRPTRKVHHIKVDVEGSSKEDPNTSEDTNCKEEGRNTASAGKKRASHSGGRAADAAKKLKMEESISNSDITNNGISENNHNPLTIELELEKRKNIPFKIRDIKTIVSECESVNKKWKETFLKYKCPARWGVPMVKNCSEKWDGKQIPPNLLYRYQKYLASNNLCHPIFFPEKDLNDFDPNKVISEMSSQSSSGTNNGFKDESANEFKKASDIGENSFTEEDNNHFSGNKQNVENNASGSSSESSGLVLRSRHYYKPVVVDEDDSSDDSDEWLSKQKPSKKQKTNSRNRKSGTQSKQELLLKLQRCYIKKTNESEVDGKSESQDDGSFASGPLIVSNTLSGGEGNSKALPDSDTEVCPICSLRFKKHQIENHASECASKTYKD